MMQNRPDSPDTATGLTGAKGTGDVQPKLGWLVLFTTLPTLFCCALPIAFVTLGFGASWASLYASLPVIGLVAAHKSWVFVASGLLLLTAFWLAFRPGQTCPADPQMARLCARAQVWNRRILYLALLVWLTGFTAAYLSVPLLEWLEG